MSTSSQPVTKYSLAFMLPNSLKYFRKESNVGSGALKSATILKKKFCKDQYMYMGEFLNKLEIDVIIS